MENLGPGVYYSEKPIENNKSSPCLNLKQQRFYHQKKTTELPGPGQYDTSAKILKKDNALSTAYRYYKKANNEEIKRNFKR